MILYRHHRGTLEESMATVKEFNTVESMKCYLARYYKGSFDIDDISLSESVIDDQRIDWKDTKYVLIKRLGNKVYKYPTAIGMCSDTNEVKFMKININCTYNEQLLLDMLPKEKRYKYILKDKHMVRAFTHMPTKYYNDLWCNNHPYGDSSGTCDLSSFRHIFTSLEQDVIYLISDLTGGENL